MSSTVVPSSTTTKKSRLLPGYSRYAFILLFSISFLNYMDRFVLTGAANTVAKELHFGLDGVGSLSSAFLIVYSISVIPLGLWADYAKRKYVVAICVAIWSCATVLTALATNFFTLFLSRMVLGIGEAGYFPAGTAFLSDYVPRERRSRVMSLWGATQFLGVLAGFVIGGFAAGKFLGSWRLAFVFTGIPGLILAFLMWRAREPRRNQADEEVWQQEEIIRAASLPDGAPVTLAPLESTLPAGLAQQETDASALPGTEIVRDAANNVETKPPFGQVVRKALLESLKLLRIRTLSALIVMQIFAFFVLAVNTTFFPIYLQQTDIFPHPNISSASAATNAGLISGVIVVLGGLSGALLGGYLAEVLGRRYRSARVFVCGIGFLLGAPMFALVTIFHQIDLFLVLSFITVLLISIYLGPSTAASQDVVPSWLRSSATAISLLIAHLFGDAFAPLIVGVLATALDPTHGQHFQQGIAGHDLSLALLITCPAALVLAGLAALLGARWMVRDVAEAEKADRLRKKA